MPVQSDKPFNNIARALLIDTPAPAEEPSKVELAAGYEFEDGEQYLFEDGAEFEFNN